MTWASVSFEARGERREISSATSSSVRVNVCPENFRATSAASIDVPMAFIISLSTRVVMCSLSTTTPSQSRMSSLNGEL